MNDTATVRTRQITVDHVSAVHAAAQAARAVALEVGLPAALPDKAAVIASELASNLDKHAESGVIYVHPLLAGVGMEIIAADRGPGMAHLDLCLTDGHTTTGTLGVGLGAIRRMAGEFLIHTAPGAGTLVSARLPAPEAQALSLGHLCLPADGENTSGDSVAAAATADGCTLLVVDALGHGPDAAWTADVATEVFHRDPDRPLEAMLAELHRMLRHTRGAVAAALRVRSGRAEFRGVGNINAVVVGAAGPRHLLSQPGVLGLRSINPARTELALGQDDTVVLHTDGIDASWVLSTVGGPILPAPLLAAHLVHHHRVPRDDAGVLVVQPPQVPHR